MLFRAFQPAHEAAQLFILVDVQIELHDFRAAPGQQLLETVDLKVAPVQLGGRREFMHALHQHRLIVRTVENHDFALLRRYRVDAPQKVVRLLDPGRRLEGLYPASLRIHRGEHVVDRAVLAARVERLQHDQQ